MNASETQELQQRLAAPFEPSEVKFKPAMVKGNRALALHYVDARAIMDRLDAVVGVDGWSDEVRRVAA
ncbi:MAG: Rad52/Rad22 family DNA repair protein [Gemmataceae bacterium]